MNSKQPDIIFKEVLSADSLTGSYMAHAYNLPGTALPDDPSWVWENIRWNPYLAMAVYEDIEEKDDMVASALESRKDSVLAKTRRVIPASQKRQDRKVADFIEETLEGGYVKSTNGVLFGMDNLVFEALDAVGKGVAISEMIFDQSGDRVYVKDMKFHPQGLFNFSAGGMAAYAANTYMQPQTGPLRLRPGIFGSASGEALPENKFFIHTYRPRHSNRWGTPLARKVFWPSWFKRAGVKQWLRFLEKGNGTVVAKYRDGAGADEQSVALEAARAANEESSIAIPEKFILEVLQHVRQSGGASHSELVDNFCNNGIARVILGQTLTSRGSEGGGSRALGDVHERVSQKKTEVDSKSVMMAFNMRMVWPLVLLNFGPGVPPPLWAIDYEPGNDLTTTAEWLKQLHEMGAPLSKNYVYNTFSGTRPESDDDVLVGKGASATPAGGERPGEDSEFAEGPTTRRLEREVEAAIWVENGALRDALPRYRRALGEVIDAVARLGNLKQAARGSFVSQFDGTFDSTFEALGDGLLASYLLALSQVRAMRDAEFDEPLQMGFEVPPREAIAYLRGKKVVTPKEFNTLVGEAREAAFSVGNVYRLDVLESFKEEIARALEAGTPQREVISKFKSILDGAGHRQLGQFHLETIWRSNMAVAYGTGRRRALEETAADLPFWQYSAVMDDRTRPEHRALDGIVYRSDHPFWDEHFPPWSWNCRCTVIALAREPRGYEHTNPSGEASLAFDARGIPSKAESGTAVYDLSVGKFKGIPRQGGLKEVVEAGLKLAKEK